MVINSMKHKASILIAAIAVLLTCVQCSKHESEPELEPNPVTPVTPKHELPLGKKALKVLAIGNSFVDDPMAYFDKIVRNSGIDCSNLCVYSAVKSSASLDKWASTCEEGTIVSIYRRSGELEMPVVEAPLAEILAQDWDVVTVQQVSTLAQDATKLLPSLPYRLPGSRHLQEVRRQ